MLPITDADAGTIVDAGKEMISLMYENRVQQIPS
jgi:hypothetical protein